MANKATQPIVDVVRARKLLGGEAKGLSDTEVISIIREMDELACLLIEMYKVQKSNMVS